MHSMRQQAALLTICSILTFSRRMHVMKKDNLSLVIWSMPTDVIPYLKA